MRKDGRCIYFHLNCCNRELIYFLKIVQTSHFIFGKLTAWNHGSNLWSVHFASRICRFSTQTKILQFSTHDPGSESDLTLLGCRFRRPTCLLYFWKNGDSAESNLAPSDWIFDRMTIILQIWTHGPCSQNNLAPSGCYFGTLIIVLTYLHMAQASKMI